MISQKFCLTCHDSDGATNTTARTRTVGTPDAFKPWEGVSTGYSTADGAAAANGLINVFSQFTTTYSSVHPVRGALNRDYPISTLLATPYNNQSASRGATGGTKSLSVVLNCFDCHNTPGKPLTDRTVAAHGNGETIRGTIYTASTLCIVCHKGYVNLPHPSGSAGATVYGTDMFMCEDCYNCHGSSGESYTPTAITTVRPVRAMDYHGYDTLVSGGVWPAPGGKPYAFIRNTSSFGGGYHNPKSGIGETFTNATCNGGGGTGCAANGGTAIYTPGGSS